MATQIIPEVDYHDDTGWHMSDRVAGTTASETPTTDKRRLRFDLEPGKSYYVVTIVGGVTRTFAPDKRMADMTNVQSRSSSGWFDFYVYEFAP